MEKTTATFSSTLDILLQEALHLCRRRPTGKLWDIRMFLLPRWYSGEGHSNFLAVALISDARLISRNTGPSAHADTLPKLPTDYTLLVCTDSSLFSTNRGRDWKSSSSVTSTPPTIWRSSRSV